MVTLVPVVDGFDRLLQTDGDKKADDDGRNMNEEVAPGVSRVVRRVDVEQCLNPLPDLLACGEIKTILSRLISMFSTEQLFPVKLTRLRR
jgi:hypothetical protein